MRESDNKQSTRASAFAALLSAAAGFGIGWAIWPATGNNAVAIGMAGPMALLTNNILRKALG